MSDKLASLLQGPSSSRGPVSSRPLTWMPPIRHAGDSLAWTDAVADAAPSREGGVFESYWDLLATIEGMPFPFQDLAFKAFIDLYGKSLWPEDEVEEVEFDPGVTLLEFVKMAWSEVEPSQTFMPNWHIDCICEHLEAIAYGQITQLLINVPPGHAKSLLVSVLFPAWQWLIKPSWRMLCATHTLELALRDAIRCRNLIESDFYQATFNPPWGLHRAQKSKRYYTNTKTGSRYSVSVGASITGFRGHALVLDDLLDAKKAFSKRRREDTLLWLDQAAMNRLNDLRNGAKIMIAQRLHEKDPCGHVLEQGGWEHVMLPTRYEGRRAFTTVLKALVNHRGEPYQYGEDPRVAEAELLFKELFPDDVIAKEEKRLGGSGFSGQHQQSPNMGEGSLFKNTHFCPDETGENFWPYPHGLAIQDAILSIDNATKAASQNDFLAISLGLLCSDGYLYMVPLMLERRSLEPALKEIMLAWARLKLGGKSTDGVDYPRLGEKLRMARIEGGLAGEPVIQSAREIAGQSRVVPTEDERLLAAAAAIYDNSVVLSALESQARRAVATLSPPSSCWTQEEWDLVREAPPLILNSYPNGGQGDIQERASGIAPYCYAGNVRLVEMRGLSVAKAWLGQLVNLGNAEHDDAVQSTVGLVRPFSDASVGSSATGQSASGDDLLARMKRNRHEPVASLGAEVKSASEVVRDAVVAKALTDAGNGAVVQCEPQHRDAVIAALKAEALAAIQSKDGPKGLKLLGAIRALGN